MAQFSAMNINLMSLNIHQGPNKKKKTCNKMYIQKQPHTMAVKQKLAGVMPSLQHNDPHDQKIPWLDKGAT
jgi:hypothetical protein